jgi:NAD(P)-dependent dehydrogenase (short-subunit alcohol dehydrogenase family)
MDLQNRVALVTGAGVRLGQAIAIALARQGVKIAVHYHRSQDGAKKTLSQLGHDEKRHMLWQADLQQIGNLPQAISDIEDRLGPIDILVNNAADFYPTPVGEVTEEQWDHLHTLNLKAPFFLSQTIGKRMVERGQGKIINLVDVSAERPWPLFLPYCASKAGLVSLTKGFAKALAPAVQVNGIAPGTVLPPPESSAFDTNLSIERSLLKRMGAPEDIAQAVLYLVQADFVTGTILPVDGGRLLAS